VSQSPPAPRARLPLRKVIWGAFALSWQHRVSLFRATALPLLVLIACTLASAVARVGESDALSWVFYFLYLAATSWLAVAVHRLVLLEESDTAALNAQNLKRVLLFVGALVGVWILFAGLVLIITSGLLNIFLMRYVPAGGKPPQLPVPIEWVNGVGIVLAIWIVARFSLVFPAIAIDHKFDLMESWRHAKRNGWRLAVVVGALPWTLERLAELLYRDGASSVEYAVIVVMTTFFTVIEVVALSLSYWELTSPAPPPTDPPA
jgi:hypothetical protein